MVNLIGVGAGTPTGFFDAPKYLANLREGTKLFPTLYESSINPSSDALQAFTRVAKVVDETKGYDFENLWSNIEKEFNRGDTIRHSAKTPGDDLQTVLGLMYGALNEIDRVATSSSDLNNFRDLYQETTTKMQNRYRNSLNAKDKGFFDRALGVIDKRLDKVITRFNELIDNQEMVGPKLAV